MYNDIGGYYGIIPKTQKYNDSYQFEANYRNYYNLQPSKCNLGATYKSYNNGIYHQIAAAVGSIGALVLGGILLKKKGGSLLKYLNPKTYTNKIKALFIRKNTDGKPVKRSFLNRFKGIFSRKKSDINAPKKSLWEKFKGIFKRKQKIYNTTPPKVNHKKIFNGKTKVKAVQKDGFIRRLFRKKPVNEIPPVVTSDIFVNNAAK